MSLGIPIALFVFARPETTELVFQSIRRAKPRSLYVFGDGSLPGDIRAESIDQARRVTESVDWPCKVTRVYRDRNIGIESNILSGVDFVLSREKNVIILEDDCVPNEDFYLFCEELLSNSQLDPKIGIVSGTNFAHRSTTTDLAFLAGHPNTWGWATHQSFWYEFQKFKVDLGYHGPLPLASKEAIPGFFQRMLFNRMASGGTAGCWDVEMAHFMHLKGYLAAIPSSNLVENVGFGEGATHTGFEGNFLRLKATKLEGIGSMVSPIRQIKLEKEASRRILLRLLSFAASNPIVTWLEIQKRVTTKVFPNKVRDKSL